MTGPGRSALEASPGGRHPETRRETPAYHIMTAVSPARSS